MAAETQARPTTVVEPPAALSLDEPKAPAVLAGARPPAEPSQPSLRTHLKHGVSLLCFRRPTLELAALGQSWSSLVHLICLSVAIPVVGDRLFVSARAHFYSLAFPGVLFAVPVLMLTAWAAARLVGQAERSVALLTVLMSIVIPIRIAEALFQVTWATHGGEPSQMMQKLFPIWFTVAATVAAIRLLATPRERWLATTVVTGLLMGLPLTTLYRLPLWYPGTPDVDDAEYAALNFRAVATEDVFYLQPKLLEEQLAQIKPRKLGVIDVYFVGLAADSYQDVFMKEVRSMARLFEERFGTAGHSLMLINNPSTARATPIASATSLGAALKRISEVMDRDEDILFLFITSHGSKEKGVEFEFSPLGLEPLTPARLKELLDQSGIRRRVVVVSACYSGQFIDVLKDDDTLVMSASASDRTSFGCGNDADFTFFGKAYFDALQQTYSFSDAFELAKPMIAAREREAHYDPSDPKISVGQNIRLALEHLARTRHPSGEGTSATVTK